MSIDVALGLLAILGLILVHAFFVASEFGLMAVERDRVEQQAREGDRKAARTMRALQTLSFQLSGVQLGITATSLVVGFLSGPAIGELIRPALASLGLAPGAATGLSLTLALLLATAAEMVIAELIPKNLAIARPTRTANATAGPMMAVNSLFKVVIVFLNASANWTVSRLGIEPRDELIPVRSLQELELLIHTSRQAGALQEEEYSLLARSITFGDKLVSDALVPRTAVIAVPRDTTVGDLTRLALETGHSRFPVYGTDLDDINGIATIKDSYKIAPAKRGEISVTEITREAMLVPESRPLEALLHDMRRTRTQMAVVVDEFGGTAGIVTIEDLLEEIVGEIEDEYDPSLPTAPQTSPIPAGVNVLSGLLHVDEVREKCHLEIPDGPYDTLAGFLLWRLDHIPSVGEHVSFNGWELKIIEMDRNRIAKVLVVSPDGRGEEAGS